VDNLSRSIKRMSEMDDTGMPDFDRPPVIETILGVHFAPVKGLTTAHLGLFWNSLGKQHWPSVHELPSIIPQVERFDISPSARHQFLFQMMDRPEIRMRFTHADENKVVQLQHNLLQTHWIHTPGSVYPRYTKSTKPEFLEIWRKFGIFLAESELPIPQLLQWEVTYINRIPSGNEELWQSPDDWRLLFIDAMVSPKTPDATIESASVTHHYRLKNDRGRLHVALQHAVGTDGQTESLDVTLTARGPISAKVQSTNSPYSDEYLDLLSQGLDIGRHAIVRSFHAFATPKALKFWGLRQEKSND
jgi:uncharacterized protein (TIGR04255 family)